MDLGSDCSSTDRNMSISSIYIQWGLYYKSRPAFFQTEMLSQKDKIEGLSQMKGLSQNPFP